jgi:hypothetical protein
MLLTFWRSQAPFRVRIASTSKARRARPPSSASNRGDQFKPEHRAQNPSLVVPTSYNGNAKLVHLATLWFGQSAPGRQILQARMLAR